MDRASKHEEIKRKVMIDQLRDLYDIANKFGLYDTADFILKIIQTKKKS